MRTTLVPPAGRVLRALLAFALAVGFVLTGPAGRAGAQSPQASSQGTILATPAMVFVRTEINVCIREKGVGGACFRTGYTGSGFFVAQNVVATAGHVVQPDEDEVVGLHNYAVNSWFEILEKGDDPEDRYTHPVLDPDLQPCYDGDSCTFRITPTVSVYPAVQIAGVSTPKPLPATVVKYSEFKDIDVAILKVDAKNAPTVPLAPSTADVATGDEVIALGYPGSRTDLPSGMTEPATKYGRVSNVQAAPAGAGQQIGLDINIEKGMSGGPVIGARHGKVIGLTSYALIGSDGTQGTVYIRTVDDIRAALKSAGLEARRGEVDNVFESAMRLFWDHHYSAALPQFQKVVNLYDGHPLAKQYLAKAQAEANGPNDVPLPAPDQDSGRGPLLIVLAAGVALLIIAAVVVAVVAGRGRRARRPAQRAEAEGAAQAPLPDWPPEPLVTPQPEQATGAWSPGRDGAGPTDQEPQRPATGVLAPERPWPAAEPGQPASVKAPRRFCRHCGHELGPDSRFCDACGQPVR